MLKRLSPSCSPSISEISLIKTQTTRQFILFSIIFFLLQRTTETDKTIDDRQSFRNRFHTKQNGSIPNEKNNFASLANIDAMTPNLDEVIQVNFFYLTLHFSVNYLKSRRNDQIKLPKFPKILH